MSSLEYQPGDESENDYDIADMPIYAQYHTRNLIEFRIKLYLKNNVVIYPGAEQVVQTCCLITVQPPHLTMHIKIGERMPVVLETEGVLAPAFRGRICVRLNNFSISPITITRNVIIGYLIIQPNLSF